jgi:PleD family two-component response regulator
MKYPQVVVYESGGWLAGQVKRLASEHAWLVRESRQLEACRVLATEDRPTVLLLHLEKDLVEILSLLRDVHAAAPDTAIVLVSDVKMESSDQRTQLTSLAFDLGVRYVLFPPLQQTVIEDLVAGLMAATVTREVSG